MSRSRKISNKISKVDLEITDDGLYCFFKRPDSMIKRKNMKKTKRKKKTLKMIQIEL